MHAPRFHKLWDAMVLVVAFVVMCVFIVGAAREPPLITPQHHFHGRFTNRPYESEMPTKRDLHPAPPSALCKNIWQRRENLGGDAGKMAVNFYGTEHNDNRESRMTIEHKKVLITGNGFDLSFGLPTAYKDFVDAMKVLRDAGDDLSKFALAKLLPEKFAGATATVDFSLLAQPISAKNVPDRMPLDNIWMNYFVQRLDKMPTTARWVDFEAEIREVLKALTKLRQKEKEHTEEKGGRTFKKVTSTESIVSNSILLEGEFLELLKNVGVLINYKKGLDKDYVTQNPLEKIQPTGSNEQPIYKEQGKSIPDLKIIDALNSQLAELCSIFAYFLKQTLEPIYAEKLKTINEVLFIDFGEVYSFNYTDTFERINQRIEVHHIHGDLSGNGIAQKNELLNYGSKVVLGVNNADDFVEFLGAEVLSMTKYFQTLYKKTDAAMLSKNIEHTISAGGALEQETMFNNGVVHAYIDGVETHIIPHHFYVWGHSLDLSDRKYIQRLFDLMWHKNGAKNDNKITIYYYDEASRASLLRNILDARMLGDAGKEKIDLLVYQGRLTFEPNPSVFKEANPDAKP